MKYIFKDISAKYFSSPRAHTEGGSGEGRARGQRGKNGFTLIETMVVVAIVAIIAAIAVPNFMSMIPKMRVNRAAKEFVGEVMAARMGAVKENLEYRIVIDKSNNSYLVQRVKNGVATAIRDVTLPNGIVFNTNNVAWPSTDFPAPYNYITPSNCSFCGSNPTGTLSFLSDGTSSDGSVVFIPSEDDISGARTDRLRAVVIVATTGVARVLAP